MRQLKVHECNYPIYDLDLAIVVFLLKIWRNYIYRIDYEIYTNHLSLQTLLTHRVRDSKQPRLIKLLNYYDISILYISTKGNVVATP